MRPSCAMELEEREEILMFEGGGGRRSLGSLYKTWLGGRVNFGLLSVKFGYSQ